MADAPKSRRKERFTMLEPMGPNNPSPEELATRIVEALINVGPVEPIPPAVRDIVAQAAAAVRTLDPAARAAAVAEFTRLAG